MTSKSFLFIREPVWHGHRRGSQHHLPENVQSWTYEAGSLTRRLRDYYGNTIAVSILFHQWRTPFLSECRQLQLPLHRYGLTREVILHKNGKPLLLARTIIPEETIKVAHRNLSDLGNRPLGEVIFSYPDLERITMDLALIAPATWTSQAQRKANIDQPTWGRRTLYAIRERPMLVSEFFLPEILTH
ncbi:chorismate--pyruvate lyase family protein [Methyloglobulus sp.]|uniref:chorismate--pyruvate lyase family protein n=1 Tax=Methyloglobulus sp. TaxID=2518622 RepID=UPI003988B1C0